MLIKFKKTGRIVDTKASEKLIGLGLAESIENGKSIKNTEKPVITNENQQIKKQIVKKQVQKKRGRPKVKK